MRRRWFGALAACAALVGVLLAFSVSSGQTPPPAPGALPPVPVIPTSLPPAHVVDLMTAHGSSAFRAHWRTHEAHIVQTEPVTGAMPQYKTAYDISPHAGEAGYDDAHWPVIDAEHLAARRGGGHVSFIWYRTHLTIPARVGDFDTAGAMAVLRVLVDDYAEVWVDGQMPRRPGYPSPATIAGYNLPNRVVLSSAVTPGDEFQVAILGINGPISVAPANFVWFREAKLEFYR